MAIDLFSLAAIFFNAAFPQFDAHVSQSNTDKFKTFFTANEDWPTVDDSNTFLKATFFLGMVNALLF